MPYSLLLVNTFELNILINMERRCGSQHNGCFHQLKDSIEDEIGGVMQRKIWVDFSTCLCQETVWIGRQVGMQFQIGSRCKNTDCEIELNV